MDRRGSWKKKWRSVFFQVFFHLIDKIRIVGVWFYRIHQIHQTSVTGGNRGYLRDRRSFSPKLKHRCHWSLKYNNNNTYRHGSFSTDFSLLQIQESFHKVKWMYESAPSPNWSLHWFPIIHWSQIKYKIKEIRSKENNLFRIEFSCLLIRSGWQGS